MQNLKYQVLSTALPSVSLALESSKNIAQSFFEIPRLSNILQKADHEGQVLAFPFFLLIKIKQGNFFGFRLITYLIISQSFLNDKALIM